MDSRKHSLRDTTDLGPRWRQTGTDSGAIVDQGLQVISEQRAVELLVCLPWRERRAGCPGMVLGSLGVSRSGCGCAGAGGDVGAGVSLVVGGWGGTGCCCDAQSGFVETVC